MTCANQTQSWISLRLTPLRARFSSSLGSCRNNALVTDYKQLQGMYPHAAGLIASNGPYQTVEDLFRLPGATANDKALFTQYRKELVALPPGRTFYERINARQST